MPDDRQETPPAPYIGADEFAGIEPAPQQRSPLVALLVLGLCALVGFQLRSELQYFFRSHTPVDLGAAEKLSPGALVDNTFVQLSGLPDRRNALYIEPKGAKDRRTFFGLRGTDNRLFVNAQPLSADREPTDRWQGRLRRLDAVAYGGSLREHFATVRVARYIALDQLPALKWNGVLNLSDRSGKPVAFDSAREQLEFDVTFPEQYQVELPREKFPTEGDARHELDRLKLEVVVTVETTDTYGYVIHVPAAQRDAVLKVIGEQRIPVAAHEEHFKVQPAELKFVDGKVIFPPRSWQPQVFWGQLKVPAKVDFFAGGVPWSTVRAASVTVASPIAADAFVLDEGERPEEYWWPPVLLGLLVIFAGFNLWYLLRARRPRAV